MSTSLVILIPASLIDTANALGNALGLGSRNFTVRLTPADDESETPEVTHYGLLHQAAEPRFLATMKAAQDGVLPEIDWESHGLTVEQVAEVIQMMTYSISPDPEAEEPVSHAGPRAHFEHVITGLGLRIAG
ncbi:MAG: hypothetical protein COB05_18225 [Marinobacter sp.]|nr:MAG: hypothetical protein COB05_18225 [Marinobacter sp.]